MRSWCQNVVQNLFNRESGLSGNRRCVASQPHNQGELLQSIYFEAKATTIPLPPATDTAGLPIVAKFNKNSTYCNRQLLAIGGEEGFITIASTEHLHALERDVLDGTWRPQAHWPCHRNSIFDLAWAKDDSVLYTASGHQQVGIWDTETARGLAVAEGHEGSVKAVSPLHLCEDIFATGARDGRIMLWDARCPGFSGQAPVASRRNAGCGLDGVSVLSPVWVQDGAHTRPAASGSRSSSKIARPAPVTVTSVTFIPYSYLLASAGAQDTVVKLWDFRMQGLPLCDLELPRSSAVGGRTRGKAATAACQETPHEIAAYCCPTWAAAVGVTHMAVSESGDRIIVSCLDSQHHIFSLSRLAAGPCATWRAPAPALKSSFYMRSAFSPCGDYVLCGSRDCGAHIWCVADPQRPAIELLHEQEVTGVAWSSGDWAKVATCSDTGEVRVWSLSRLPAQAACRDRDEVALGKGGVGVEGWAEEKEEERAAVKRGQQVVEAAMQGVHLASTDKLAISEAVATAAASAFVTPEAAKAATRRMVQSRLNLECTGQRATPVPAPPAAAPVTPGAGDRAGMQNGAEQPEHADMGPTIHIPAIADAKLAGAAAVRASALSSPVSVPARPSGHRVFVLPPVPVFSPALNHWQPQEGHVQQQRETREIQSLEVAADDAAALPSPSVCGGLEEAMKGLAHVRTQSPARLPQRCEVHSDAPGAPFCGGARSANNPMMPPPGQVPHAFSQPPSPNTHLAARAPAMSPHAISNSCRSRSRLGPFSPSRSSHSSGGGGSGTPSGSARLSSGHSHHAPQGVVSQILRNSPRLGARASAGDPMGRSPRSQRSLADSDGGAVPRQLFPPEDQSRGRPALPQAQPSDWGYQSADTGAGADLFAWDPLAAGPSSGTAVVAAVDRLLQQPGPVPFVHPSARSRNPFASPPHAHVVYDIRDGEDVGPALRHRAMNPDENGPFEGVLGARSDDEQGQDDAAVGAEGHSSDSDWESGSGDRPAGAARSHRGDLPQGIRSGFPLALFGWEGTERSAQLETLASGSAVPSVDGFDWHWPARRISASSGFLAAGGPPLGIEGDEDKDDYSDWEADPYRDKENTPPPEPLDAPLPAVPTSSASGGGGSAGIPQSTAVAPSPRPPSQDLALPARLLERTTSSERRLGETVRLLTPFAAAHTHAETAGATAPAAELIIQGESSLHTEPTVSAGIAPSSEDTGTGDVAGGGLPSLGREWLTVAGTGVDVENGYRQATSPRRVTQAHWAREDDTEPAAGDNGIRSRDGPSVNPHPHGEHLTPTKRPRRAFSSGADPGSLSAERSPSPTRRVRSSGTLLPPLSTPSGKQRPVAGVATVMPSPSVRGSAFGSRGAGGSRLAPAACAGYLIPGPAAMAAAGIGSESPMPKIGTASRTARHATAASEEFLKRRAEEERDSANMSPFGFGLFSPAAAAATPSGATLSAAVPHQQQPPSCLARSGAAGDFDVSVGSGRLFREDDAGRRLGETVVEDDEDTIDSSVRSLSCVFETQTQGGSTVVVPCTFPGEDVRAMEQEGLGWGSSGAERRERQHVCSQLSVEERTVGSPHPFGVATGEGLAEGNGVENGGNYEPQAQAPNGGLGRACSIPFGSLVRHAGQKLHNPQQQHRCPNNIAGWRSGLPPLPLDENSRCFPVPGVGGMAAGGGGALEDRDAPRVPATAQWPSQPYEHQQPSHGGTPPLLQEALSLSSGGGVGAASPSLRPSREPQQHTFRLDAVLPRLPHAPQMNVETGNVGTAAAGDLPARQQHVDLVARKPRQQTLLQCWGSVNVSVGQQHWVPLGLGMPVVVPVTTHRVLGPTGLTSPRYFR